MLGLSASAAVRLRHSKVAFAISTAVCSWDRVLRIAEGFPKIIEIVQSGHQVFNTCLIQNLVFRTLGGFRILLEHPDMKVLALPGFLLEYDESFIRFAVGEMPHMPSTPDRYICFRFGSKVSGRLRAPAARYIREVRHIARKHFGTRVHYLHEMDETDDNRQWGCYGWSEVQAAERELTDMSLRTEHEHGQRLYVAHNYISITHGTQSQPCALSSIYSFGILLYTSCLCLAVIGRFLTGMEWKGVEGDKYFESLRRAGGQPTLRG